MALITINGITYDPESPAPAGMAAMEAPDAATSNYILVQTTGPLTAEQRSQLADLGVTVKEYVPENTYLTNFPGTDLGPIRSLPFVAWANVYSPAFKIPPSLLGIPTTTAPIGLAAAAAAQPASPSNTPVAVDIVLHNDVDPESVRDRLATVAGVSPETLPLGQRIVRLVVPSSRLTDLAAIDEVQTVEPSPVYGLHNNVARQILGVETPQGAPLPLDGRGQVVAVADTGFDRGTPTDVHPAFTDRVRRLYALGRPNDASDPHGHGTHVAGSVLGDGASAALGGSVRGTAPGASLVLQSVLDQSGSLSGIPVDLADLLRPPYLDEGARVHTNSWGIIDPGQFGRYTGQSAAVDGVVWQNRDYVVCFSAGNEGEDRDSDGQVNLGSVTPPATAKNCITVGASENRRPEMTSTYGQWWPDDFPASRITSDRMADNPDGMVAFSGRGPTTNERIKPDVVAPGTFILSTRGRVATGPTWGPSADPLFVFLGGTSMATPLVAGCAALIRQHLIDQRGIPAPSAALVKALLINGAQNITGQYVPSEAGAIPNVNEGFGRVNVADSIAPQGETVEVRDEGAALETGQSEEVAVTIPANSARLKVTLVWTDPPGAALQNDLDLIVRAANGEERHGNAPQDSDAFDRSNNVEQAVWQDPPAGEARIIVRAFRIAASPQSYALVWRVR